MFKYLPLGAAVMLGVGALANGVYMLASPAYWYLLVPGVTTTGPFNQHFIRDIGLVFLFIGTAFLLGAAMTRYRVVLWAVSTLWLGSHALFHFWEVAVGICEASAIARDFPAVTLPVIIGAAMTFWAMRDQRASASDASFDLHAYADRGAA